MKIGKTTDSNLGLQMLSVLIKNTQNRSYDLNKNTLAISLVYVNNNPVRAFQSVSPIQ